MKKAGAVKGSFFATRHCVAQELVDGAACVWEIPSSIGRFLDAGLLPGTFERISDSIWAEQGAVIEHGASVEGRLVIGRGSVVKRNAVLRGDNIIGRDCLVGNFTEVKNCLFFDGVQMPHFSYAGDSVLGYKAHLGAGAKISNFKSDGSPVDLSFSDGRLKFGAEKARLVSMALFLLVFGSVALLGLAMDNGFVLPALPAWLAAALPGLLAIVSVGGFALSYCISQAVYAKKEF